MRYFQVLYRTDEGYYSSRRIIDQTNVLYSEFGGKTAVYAGAAEGMKSGFVYINVISRDNCITRKRVEKIAEEAVSRWDVADGIKIVEVCEKAFVDTDFFPFHLDLRKLTRVVPCLEMRALILGGRGDVKEVEARPRKKADCRKLVEGTPWEASLEAELERMFGTDCARRKKTKGERLAQFVHYMLDSAENHLVDSAIESLVCAKLENGTLLSPRVFEIDFDRFDLERRVNHGELSFNELFTDSLGYALSGNTVVLKYGGEESYGSYDLNAFRCFSKMLEVLKPYVLDTFIILAIKGENPALVGRVKNMLDMPVVHIESSLGNGRCLTREAAVENFRQRARKDGVAFDARLEEMFDEAKEAQTLVSSDALYETWRAGVVGKSAYEPELREFRERKASRKGGKSAMSKLDELVGLASVKEQIKQVISCEAMAKVERSLGVEPERRTLHLAFKGAPGTGKTEVAKLYAEILKEAGILTTGTLVIKSGAGWDIDKGFEEAKGGVLFIDEAYALMYYSDTTRLIANMENHRDEVVVILAGYKEHIDALISTNPEFKSRIGFEINFPDYTADELVDIFKLMCRRNGMSMEADAEEEMKNIISRAGRRSDQGNARFVRRLFEDACLNKECRLFERKKEDEGHVFKKKEVTTLTKHDILKMRPSGGAEKDAMEQLEKMIGLDEVKKEVKRIVAFNKMQKLRRSRGLDSSFMPMHMAFTGNPGTGKTQVARLIGKILHQEGLLSVGDFRECGKADLVYPASGYSTSMVNDLFKRSIGGVIFIDEAYSLVSSADGCESEAVAALIANMENHREEVVVIFAGYEREMDELLRSNAGFASRVKTRLHFRDYTPQELVEIFELMSAEKGLILGEGVKAGLEKLFGKAAEKEGGGNARFARNVLDETLLAQSLRIAALPDGGEGLDKEELQTILEQDLTAPADVLRPGRTRPVGFTSQLS